MKLKKNVCLDCAEGWLKAHIEKHPEMKGALEGPLAVRDRLEHKQGATLSHVICFAFANHKDPNRLFVTFPDGELPDECPNAEKHKA